MAKKNVYLTLPCDDYRDLVIRADHEDMDKVNKLLDLLTKVSFLVVNKDTYKDTGQAFNVSKMEVVEELRVVWEKHLEWGIQSHYNYNYNDWLKADSPRTMEEIEPSKEDESCVN
tara:strand:+ start:1772 stop:2116 length:345 start_codon:yes stop_codon:yes gene_type:complete